MKAFAVALLGLFALTPVAEARTRLSGAGASFPSKIYSRWFYDLAKEKDLELTIKQLVLVLEEKHS